MSTETYEIANKFTFPQDTDLQEEHLSQLKGCRRRLKITGD